MAEGVRLRHEEGEGGRSSRRRRSHRSGSGACHIAWTASWRPRATASPPSPIGAHRNAASATMWVRAASTAGTGVMDGLWERASAHWSAMRARGTSHRSSEQIQRLSRPRAPNNRPRSLWEPGSAVPPTPVGEAPGIKGRGPGKRGEDAFKSTQIQRCRVRAPGSPPLAFDVA